MSTTGPNLQNIPIRTPEGARIRGLFVNHTMDMTDAIMAEVDRITRELEAYRKAKAENDERFMIERDEARRERDEARRMLGECYVLSGADTDGNGWTHLWPHAVRAVAELRADFDEACECFMYPEK